MDDERKIEILEALMDDDLWGLVSVEMDGGESRSDLATRDGGFQRNLRYKGDGILLYEDNSRVGGEPAIEIPHEDPYLVDESTHTSGLTGETIHFDDVSPPPKTFEEMLSEYGCVTKSSSGFTYVVVDGSESQRDLATTASHETPSVCRDSEATLLPRPESSENSPNENVVSKRPPAGDDE